MLNIMAASLKSLPSEILQLILTEVEDQRDKLSLVSCCSRVYGLALPYCYTSLKLETPSYLTLRRLLRTIRRNPHLGQAVQDLQINGWYTLRVPKHSLGYKLYERVDIPDDYPLLDEAVEYFGYSPLDIAVLRASAEQRNADIFVALLLIALPNIRRLDLGVPCGDVYVTRLLRQAAKRQKPFISRPPFPKLTHVRVSPWRSSGWEGAPRSFIQPFFAFPNVRSISADSLSDYIDASDTLCPKISWPAASSVTQIELINCTSFSSLIDMIRACVNLESFKDVRPDVQTVRDSGPFPSFRLSLEPAKSTLQTLSLGFRSSNPLSSWTEFSILRNIRLSFSNVIDFREDCRENPSTPLTAIFPPSLQSLFITECSQGIAPRLVSEFENLALHAPSRFPRLVQIILEGNWILPDVFGRLDGFMRWIRDFNAKGGIKIRLKFHPDTWRDDEYKDVIWLI